MNSANTFTRLIGRLRGGAHRIAHAISECQYAQHRMAVLSTSPDRVAGEHRDDAPQTYAEFLFRTSGVLIREPSARQRARGLAVRP